MNHSSDFYEKLESEWIIHCSDAEERNKVLRVLVENGYRLGPCTSTYLGDNASSSEFLNPCLEGGTVSCYHGIPGPKKEKVIEYSQYIELFDESYAQPIDVPDVFEFNSMLTDLFFGKECLAHA